MSVRHGTPLGYSSDGCDCFHCRLAWARYMDDWRKGLCPTLHPAEEARSLLDVLYRAGLARKDIAVDVGVAPNCLWRIATGRVQRVHEHTLEGLRRLASTLEEPDLDPAPLVEAIEARRAVTSLAKLIPDSGLQRAYYRAAETGRIALRHADRLATEVLGAPHLLDQLEPIGANI